MFERATLGGRKRIARTIRRSGLLAIAAAGFVLMIQGAASGLPPGAPTIGMVCTPGTVSGSTRTFNLVANTGYVQTPDGNSVFMWSYASGDSPDNGTFQSPGPVLCATQGQTVVVNLTNTLPEPASVMFPGQENVSAGSSGQPGLLTQEAPARVGTTDGTVTYTFTAGNPGTYLYQSGSDISKQVEMGMYGALVVRPSIGADYAYGASTRFDATREYMLLLAEIDPTLHHAVETGHAYDFATLHNRYFTINGRSFPDTIQDNGTALLGPSQPYGALIRIQPNSPSNTLPALVRMINAGLLNHPFHPHGNHTREIAQDGRLLLSPTGGSASSEHFGETIAAGQTKDFLLRWDDQDNWNPAHTLPVGQPNYRNLTFKDGTTWYGGSPYLGYKGTLPTGTNSLNICGEWYFPLHSHALDEFTNFDEGFGGMGTLLRVDPLGGCFGFPTSTKLTAGTLGGGTYRSLGDDAGFASSNPYYRVNSTTTGASRTSDWYAQLSGVPATATNLVITYRGRNCGTGAGCPATTAIPTTLFIRNFATSTWVQLGAATDVGTTDVTITRAVANPPASFIGTGSNKGLVRVRVLTTRPGTASFVTGGDVMKLVYDAP